MSKRPDPPKLPLELDSAEPASRVRIRSPDDERFIKELHERWAAGELTADEVAERIKDFSIAQARKELSESDFRAFEHYMRHNLVLPNLEKLRR